MKKRPIVDAAYEILELNSSAMEFPLLWDALCNLEKLTELQQEELIADFYTDISVDARFVNLGNNKWDLRKNHYFNEVYVNTDEILVDDGSEEELEVDEVVTPKVEEQQ